MLQRLPAVYGGEAAEGLLVRPCARSDGGPGTADYWAWSRFAAILLDMPKSSMKPLDIDWSKVSPLS